MAKHRLMSNARGKFIQSNFFKALVLVVYIYSFIQLDADESPLKIELINMSDPFAMEKIQLEINRPFNILVRLLGKNTQDNDTSPEQN